MDDGEFDHQIEEVLAQKIRGRASVADARMLDPVLEVVNIASIDKKEPSDGTKILRQDHPVVLCVVHVICSVLTSLSLKDFLDPSHGRSKMGKRGINIINKVFRTSLKDCTTSQQRGEWAKSMLKGNAWLYEDPWAEGQPKGAFYGPLLVATFAYHVQRIKSSPAANYCTSVKCALLGWKSGVNVYAPKSKKKVGDSTNFGSSKDKVQFNTFYKTVQSISDKQWNEIWLRSLKYITQNGDGGDSGSNGADSDDGRYDNANIIMSD
ncbi:hypothetical protein BDP27DRAFT_1368660 [Rhodocollybia butyracea]|uniref:Uncharacterized protein n=1 Tax=Rhodocollybia butyracea TaxID=206335 RepID=A0A9P5U2I8_9AGAR|nr:hypothetical protein BDP27DRAFT_1368660 [Rhodocollybia butyracea]